MPASAVIPVLAYPSVADAEPGGRRHPASRFASASAIAGRDSVMIRVDDARAHRERARAHGATIALEPTEARAERVRATRARCRR